MPKCADYTVRFFLVMLAHGVEKVFIHSGASGRINDPNYEVPLFDYGSVPRKLFAAIAVMTSLLGERPASVGELQWGDFGRGVAFETGKRSLVALWSDSDERGPRVDIPDGESLIVVDVVGREIPVGSVNLSGSPAYLVGPPGQAKRLLKCSRRVGESLASGVISPTRPLVGPIPGEEKRSTRAGSTK